MYADNTAILNVGGVGDNTRRAKKKRYIHQNKAIKLVI
jgi:hypothetical protein